MPLHLRPGLQRGALLGDDLGNAFGREIHVDESGRGVGDLAIPRDPAVAQRHDRDALEHRARAFRFRQQRPIAERVARIERLAVGDRRVHVPAEIGRRAVEMIVDHRGDAGLAFERAVEHVVIDAILRE